MHFKSCLVAVFSVMAPLCLAAFSQGQETFVEGELPDTQCELVLELPENAKVRLAGDDYGARRTFSYKKLDAGKAYETKLVVTLADGKTVEHTLKLKGGRQVKFVLSEAAARSAGGELPKPELGEEEEVSGRWALLIGIDDYANANKLRFCGADQRALKTSLLKAGFAEDHIFLMHDEAKESRYRPSQLNIEKQLDVVLRLASPRDLVVVSFSGHGVALDGRSYLCPNDGTLHEPKTLIALDGLYQRLRECQAVFKMVLVDACRNDPRVGGQRSLSATEGTTALARSLKETELPDGVVLLNSCAPGEISYEEPELGHGVFMHYVLEGLLGAADTSGDGAVSLNELQSYAGTKTKTYVARKFNGLQRPFFRGDLTTEALEYALLPVKSENTKLIPTLLPESVDEVIAEALAAIRAIGDPKKRSEELQTLAGTIEKADPAGAKTAQAESLAAARSITDANERSSRLQYHADNQVKLNPAGARTTLGESVAAARAMKESSDRMFRLKTIAGSLNKAGDHAGAQRILAESLVLARQDSTVYMCSVAQTCAEIGDKAAASRAFNEAKSLDRKSSIPGFSLCMVAEYQISAGMETEGRATYAEARRYGDLDDRWKGFFAALAKLQAQRGDLKGAHTTARSISDLSSSQAQSAFCEIAEAQIKRGDIRGALATANWLTDESYRSSALSTVIQAMIERGDLPAAQSALAGVSQQSTRDSCFRSIGMAQLKHDDVQGALLTVRSMSQGNSRVSLLAETAVVLAANNDASAKSLFEEAETATHSLPEDEYVWGVSALAGAFAESGQLSRAVEFARSARTPEAKAAALRSIAGALIAQLEKRKEAEKEE